jgi:hypothetical protein
MMQGCVMLAHFCSLGKLTQGHLSLQGDYNNREDLHTPNGS